MSSKCMAVETGGHHFMCYSPQKTYQYLCERVSEEIVVIYITANGDLSLSLLINEHMKT